MRNSKLIFLTSKLILAIFIYTSFLVVKSPNSVSETKFIWGLPLAVAQTLRPEEVAAEVYQTIPDLSQENQYLSQETGEVDADNTLISRLIRYHQYVKNRPLNYRLDWKLTLADYFGVNEPIRDFRYPGSSTLQLNPLESDRAVITNLSRKQRNELVDTLIGIYNGEQSNNSTSDVSPEQSQPSSDESNSFPSLPQPGDADLLLPQ